MAINHAPLTDWLFKVTDSLDQHFICRNVECTSVIHNHHWLRQISTDYPIREQHGRYTCPRCLTPYRPHAERTNASALQSKKLVPAQKALIMAENGEVNVETPVRGQTISKEHGDYHLFLMEWEKTDDDMLLGRLKQIMAEYRADLGTEDFRAPLQAAIRDQAVKHQLLGYFEETALRGPSRTSRTSSTATLQRTARTSTAPTCYPPWHTLTSTSMRLSTPRRTSRPMASQSTAGIPHTITLVSTSTTPRQQ